MRLFALVIFFALFQFACGDGQVTSNETSKTQPQAQKEVVPNFTNADEALAAGKKYLDENKVEEAIQALKQAVKLNPESADAYFYLGIALSFEKTEESAQSEEASPQTSAKISIKSGKPVILSEADRAFDMAAKLYKKITEREPENAEAFFNLGRAYNKIQMDEEAEKALRQAVKLRPDESEYQTELGAILIKLAKYEEAVRVLKKAQELDENNLRAAELLERAEAGKARVSYTMKPKTPKPATEEEEETEEATEETSTSTSTKTETETSTETSSGDKKPSETPAEIRKP